MSTPTVTIMRMGMHTPICMTGIRTNIITTTMHMGTVMTTITRMSTAHGIRTRMTRRIRTSTAV